MPTVIRSPGLKPIEAQNASSSAWVRYLATRAAASRWYSSWACLESGRMPELTEIFSGAVLPETSLYPPATNTPQLANPTQVQQRTSSAEASLHLCWSHPHA